MPSTAQQIIEMIDMLPEKEQSLAFEIIKRLVLAWDPDFTKVTLAEAEIHADAMDEIERGDTIPHSAINWN